jgi:nitrogenase molybdenum-iron protein alpha/beta subunit
MTSDYSSTITPDSLSGMIFALEGLRNSVVLLNGPTGCKFYHSAISDNQTIKQFEFDPLNYPEKFFFGQPRVPCTYLDTGDYVYGSKDKLTQALEFLRDNLHFELLAIVNSPGAALIGDDIAGVAAKVLPGRHVLVLETPGFSSDICHGFQTAAIALLELLLPAANPPHPNHQVVDEYAPPSAAPCVNVNPNVNPSVNRCESPCVSPSPNPSASPSPNPIPSPIPSPSANPSVNILGLSLHHKYFAGDIIELKRMLALCGVSVNCCLCADASLDEIRSIPAAALNIIIHPEYGLEIGRYLHKRFGTDYLNRGLPIGFAASEALVQEVCERLGVSAAAFTEDSERARARAYAFISRVNSLTGLPKGVGFAVEGTYSELYAYTNFLVNYLAMIPGAMQLLNPQSNCAHPQLQALLDELGQPDLLQTNNETLLVSGVEILLASGTTIARAKLEQTRFTGIETALPTMGYLDIIPKTHLGTQGALFLLEQTLNALLFS